MKPEPEFHSPTPAGYTMVSLSPSGTTLTLLGLIECPEIDGARQVAQGMKAKVVSAEGVPLTQFPHRFSFRVTASLRKMMPDRASNSVSTDYAPQQFLLKLKFKLKAYHGLQVRNVFPQSVQLIGMPADVAYDERIFRVNFDVDDNFPVSDRVVLVVLSPEDQPLTHFTFGLL